MSTSIVAICNRALDLIGADPIVSLDDPNKPARLASRNFPAARDAVLRAYPWNGAIRRRRLAAMTAEPEWGFARQYQLPDDALRLLGLSDDGDQAWRVEGRRILTDAGPPLDVLYIARIEDPADFDPLLADTIAARLAADIAYALAGSSTGQQAAWQFYQARLVEARMIDAQEGTPAPLSADAWLAARR